MSSALKKGRAVLIGGKPYKREADGSLVPMAGQTNFDQLDAMTDAQVEAGAKSDPDSLAMSDEEWAEAEISKPLKVPMTVRVDSDVLDWFKGNGKGYQTRITTVLRRYMETQKKAG